MGGNITKTESPCNYGESHSSSPYNVYMVESYHCYFMISNEALFNNDLVNDKYILSLIHPKHYLPQGEQEWLNIAKQFNDVWNFPNCVGSVDGKHVVLQAPINTGSEFFNYKSTFSIVLMAVVDADYCFTFADVGCQGRISDGGVIKNTSFYKKLQGNELHLPSDNALPNTEKVLPYVFVADDAFPLEEHIMKPYPGSHQEDSIERIFNYRLSRARRVVENAFGILSVVFRVLRKPMLLEPHKAAKVVLACIYLHNYLRRSKSSRNIYTRQDTFDQEIDGKIIQGSWRQEREANPTSLLPIRNIPRVQEYIIVDTQPTLLIVSEVSWSHETTLLLIDLYRQLRNKEGFLQIKNMKKL
nr:unnamed protein product [Callosobruchus analis]